MKEKEKIHSIINYNIIIILCTMLVLIAGYISYDKYFGPTYNWFGYQEKNKIINNCEVSIKKLKNEEIKLKENDWKKVQATYTDAKGLINGNKLLSPYVDIKVNDLNLSCKKIQKDLLAIYFSNEVITNILNTFTLNNEFVDCIIKDTEENYGPRNIFSNTIFKLESESNITPLAYEENYYLTSIDNHYIIFEKINDVWKITQY